METQSIPWREKVQLIVRFLRGSIHYFVVALLCACLGMVFNALTPQVIRLTVDSILGAEQPSLPAFLQPLLPLLQAQKLHALWLAAAAVLLLALLRGFCNYGQRTQRQHNVAIKVVADNRHQEQCHHNDPLHRFQAAPASLSFGIRTHKPTCQKYSTKIFTPRSRGKPNRNAY